MVRASPSLAPNPPPTDLTPPPPSSAADTTSSIYVYTYASGTYEYLGPLASSSGALSGGHDLTFRPGVYVEVSPVSPPPPAVAGVPVVSPLLMYDRYNNTVPTSHTTSSSVLDLEVTAVGKFPRPDGTNVTLTLTGGFEVDASYPPHAALSATIEVTYAGDWELHVKQGAKHFLGSPLSFHVSPAPTDPASCDVTYSKVSERAKLLLVCERSG